jgi:hypothetical protein
MEKVASFSVLYGTLSLVLERANYQYSNTYRQYDGGCVWPIAPVVLSIQSTMMLVS